MTLALRGLRAWLFQRMSAVYMAAYLIVFSVLAWREWPFTFESWRAWIQDTTIAVFTAGFFVAVLIHAWVGLRDVVLDYITPTGLRFTVLSSIAIALSALGLWVLRILLAGPL